MFIRFSSISSVIFLMLIAICHVSATCVIKIGDEAHSLFRISEIGGERNGAKVTTRYLNLSVGGALTGGLAFATPAPPVARHPRPGEV